MGLLSFLLNQKRDKSTKPSNAMVAAGYEEWYQNTTSADIRDLFLTSLKEGNDVLDVDVTPAELQYFDDLVAGFDITSDGQLQMDSIIHHLTSTHTTKSEVIQLYASILGNLIIAHACFPFSSPVLLTKDAFCRAILLLTDRCESNFKQATGTGGHETMRKRSEQKRLEFIHSALARPPTGTPTHDDILDVISRVQYPRLIAPKGVVRRHPITDFSLMAERLEPAKDQILPDPLPISVLKPLENLVVAFPPRYTEAASDLSFEGGGELNAEEFVQWATKVQLLDTLDHLFSTFLLKT